MANSQRKRSRPHSPNIQIYRPQLTSVLSIINRMTGVVLSAVAVVLVIWLIAAASGPQAYTVVRLASLPGSARSHWSEALLLFSCIFAAASGICFGISASGSDSGRSTSLDGAWWRRA